MVLEIILKLVDAATAALSFATAILLYINNRPGSSIKGGPVIPASALNRGPMITKSYHDSYISCNLLSLCLSICTISL